MRKAILAAFFAIPLLAVITVAASVLRADLRASRGRYARWR